LKDSNCCSLPLPRRVRAKSSRPALFVAYDDASDRLMDGLRGNGIPDQQLQAVHKALARLRLALEESSR
jgi:hypothetical protein